MKNLDIYDSIIDLNPNFERKGKTMPYTSANGYMFTLLNKAGEIGFRLPKEEQKIFKETYEGSGPFISYNATMKDYVLIPEYLYTETEILAKYLQMAYDFVMSLPPK
ncbi:MAG: hypothetical protein AAFN10_03335 [Bacteroidota bacterium]